MWLLSTDRAELHAFVSPEDVPDGYAILSHVWDKEEQSFQDLRALQKECAADGSNPRDKASEKIRRCCEVAEAHGFRWIWNDTCCIDKTSSAELSEAINSMYRYYSLAKVCFTYLGDISRLYEFDESRWLQRGWTLQELLAPRLVVFLSREWTVLGTKFKLSAVLEQVTGIPAAVLRHEMRPADLSIAVRMGFAARRITTRPEDRAYSLMGLFDVNIPTLYGEGAFRRLQEEIMRHFPDMDLFRKYYTDDFDAWFPPNFVRPPSFRPVLSIAVVNLARLTNQPEMLPSALMDCSTLGAEIVDGLVREDGTRETLALDDLGRCFVGRTKMAQESARIAHQMFRQTVAPACKHPSCCQRVLQRLLNALGDVRELELVHPLDGELETGDPHPGGRVGVAWATGLDSGQLSVDKDDGI